MSNETHLPVVCSVLINLCVHGMVDSDAVPLWRPLQIGTPAVKNGLLWSPSMSGLLVGIVCKACLVVSKRSPIDEVHPFLEARAMLPLISDLFQEHPSMNHLVE